MDLNKEIKLSDLFRRNRGPVADDMREGGEGSCGAQGAQELLVLARPQGAQGSQGAEDAEGEGDRREVGSAASCRAAHARVRPHAEGGDARERLTGRSRQDRCRAARPRLPRRPRRLLPLRRGRSDVQARPSSTTCARSSPSSKCRPRSRRRARRRSQPTDRRARPRSRRRLRPGSPGTGSSARCPSSSRRTSG